MYVRIIDENFIDISDLTSQELRSIIEEANLENKEKKKFK